jgi:hypothetical protein
MTDLVILAAALSAIGWATGIIGVIVLVAGMQRRPYNSEKAPVKSSPGRGVLWSFTLGMAPWKKESATGHIVEYIRGVLFHLCIFLGAALLIASPWLTMMPQWLLFTVAVIMAIGAVLGLAGFLIRRHDPILRSLSTPDDYFALALVTLFLAAASSAALLTALVPVLWLVSGITIAYIPFGKLKHFIYFVYSRVFLGLVFGRRGVLE